MKSISDASSIFLQMVIIAQKEIKAEKLNMRQKTLIETATEQLKARGELEKYREVKECKHKNKYLISRGNEDIRSLYGCNGCGQIVSIFDYDKD